MCIEFGLSKSLLMIFHLQRNTVWKETKITEAFIFWPILDPSAEIKKNRWVFGSNQNKKIYWPLYNFTVAAAVYCKIAVQMGALNEP